MAKKSYSGIFIILAIISMLVSVPSCAKKLSEVASVKRRDFNDVTARPAAGAPAQAAPTDAAKSASPNSPAALKDMKLDRKVITTGTLAIQVKSVDAALAEINRIIGPGGFVTSSNVQMNEDNTKSGTVVVRFPQAGFGETLAKIKSLGVVKNEKIAGEDVTEEYVDLGSRLKNLQREEAQFLTIMEKAYTIDDILKVEGELARVRGDIETVTGRMKFLENSSDLATITVELSEERKIVSEKQPAFWNVSETTTGAVSSFLRTVRAFLEMGIWLGVYSPFIIVIILIIVLFRRIRARRSGRTGPPPAV